MASDGSINGLMETKTATPPTFEDVLDKLGMPGRFQITQLTLGLISMTILAYATMAFVFLGHEPTHVCNKVNKTTFLTRHHVTDSGARIKYESCDIAIFNNDNGSEHTINTMSCPNGRNFSDAKHTTWLSEWDLVCESKGLAELSFTFYNAGLVLGGLFWSAIADRFGRKPVLIFCSFMCSFWEAVIILAPNIYAIHGLRFVSGIFRQGLAEVFFVLGLEFLATRHRETYGVIMLSKWTLDVLLVGLTGYFLQDYDWKYMQATVSISGCFVVFFPFLMEESPRWLTAKHRFDEALEILKRACHQNGKDFSEVKEIYERFISRQGHQTLEIQNEALEPLSKTSDETKQELSTEIKQQKPESITILTLFSSRDLAILTLSSWFIWFANNMTYFGLFIVSTALVGNRFLNYALVGLVEIPSNAIILVMMRKMKRLLVAKIWLMAAACSLLVYSLLNTFGGEGSFMGIANVVFFVLGKLCITASYYTLNILTPEIFPTTLRATANASCNSCSRVGSMLIPFMRPLITIVSWGPGVIFTVVCFIAVILMRFLPETKDKGLVDTVADFKQTVSNKRGKTI